MITESSTDIWAFGTILLEIITGFPIWMPVTSRIFTSSGIPA